MKFMVKPLVPVSMTPFSMAAGAACETLTCSLDCNVSGNCTDFVCGLRIIKPKVQGTAN